MTETLPLTLIRDPLGGECKTRDTEIGQSPEHTESSALSEVVWGMDEGTVGFHVVWPEEYYFILSLLSFYNL